MFTGLGKLSEVHMPAAVALALKLGRSGAPRHECESVHVYVCVFVCVHVIC